MSDSFRNGFEGLMGFPPFNWQARLYCDLLSRDIPSALDIPTGLGKTSVMAVWYLALKAGAMLPRRLVYVVDRRAVVDQATTEAQRIQERSSDVGLRVSTLRGQHIDNREWLADPAAPTIVVGTVDMIGSRVLFSGYGVSRKMRPYHAGLLGVDTLLVLDEAHLVPPFEKLLETIVNGAHVFGPREHNDRNLIPPLRLLSLSATGRNSGVGRQKVFKLEEADSTEGMVKKRLDARKHTTIQVLDEAPKLTSKLAEQAWIYGKRVARVLVYCDRRDDALKVKGEIDKKFKKERCEPVSELLVGGRRMREREGLSNWLRKHGFLGEAGGRPKQPTFLIATSAGEVGVDLDADHMVCDLVEWERMVQRLGRVNRRGNGEACVDVIAAPRAKEKPDDWEERLHRLRRPLDDLRGNASPGAILDLKIRADQDPDLRNAVEAATTPVPLRPALTRALVDAWSLTSLDEHTGRPDDIQPWLRGWEDNQQPQTTVVWRKYLPVRRGGSPATGPDIEAFFEAAPPHASEKLETETDRVVDWLMKRAKGAKNSQFRNGVVNSDVTLTSEGVIAYILSPSMDLRDVLCAESLMKDDKKEEGEIQKSLRRTLSGGTLIIGYRFCGLSKEGMLDEMDGGLPRVIDDGEGWLTSLSDGSPVVRFRVRSVTSEDDSASEGMWRERHRFETERTPEGDVTRWLVVEKWRNDSETEEDRSTGPPQELAEHHAWTESKARALAKALGLPHSYARMLAVAARLHDEGKRHKRWQHAFNAPRDGRVYAKTKGPINVRRLEGYRHEFGSLPYAEKDEGLNALPVDLQDLALHLVAAHHGWARPVISTSGCEDPPSILETRARDVALRFGRLQRRWGAWGLSWWEALLRAADQQASRDNDAREHN